MFKEANMRVLVTGGAGYIGSHTVKELLLKGYYPITIDNLKEGHKESLVGGEFFLGDLGNIEDLRYVFKKYQVEAVIHFAASCYVGESVSQPLDYYFNNLANGLNLLKVMVESGVKKLIFSSSCAVYGNPVKIPMNEDHPQAPVNPYGNTKQMFERILVDHERAYGIKYMSLRYFNAAGAAPGGEIGEDHSPETHLIPLVLETAMGKKDAIEVFGSDYDTPDGTCIRDFIHVTDLAQAHILALEYLSSISKSACYNLGTGKGYSVKEIINISQEITGKSIAYREVGRREGDPPVLIADAKKIKEELGWEPQFSDIKRIITTAWEWHSKHPNGFRKETVT
jgi:UDP-glucose 4-epimerase